MQQYNTLYKYKTLNFKILVLGIYLLTNLLHVIFYIILAVSYTRQNRRLNYFGYILQPFGSNDFI